LIYNSFAHSTNICKVPALCQVLFYPSGKIGKWEREKCLSVDYKGIDQGTTQYDVTVVYLCYGTVLKEPKLIAGVPLAQIP
jgi:hypothetical protein